MDKIYPQSIKINQVFLYNNKKYIRIYHNEITIPNSDTYYLI